MTQINASTQTENKPMMVGYERRVWQRLTERHQLYVFESVDVRMVARWVDAGMAVVWPMETDHLWVMTTERYAETEYDNVMTGDQVRAWADTTACNCQEKYETVPVAGVGSSNGAVSTMILGALALSLNPDTSGRQLDVALEPLRRRACEAEFFDPCARVLAERSLDALWYALRGRPRSDDRPALPSLRYSTLLLAAGTEHPAGVSALIRFWEAVADEVSGCDPGDCPDRVAAEIGRIPASAVRDRLADWLASSVRVGQEQARYRYKVVADEVLMAVTTNQEWYATEAQAWENA